MSFDIELKIKLFCKQAKLSQELRFKSPLSIND